METRVLEKMQCLFFMRAEVFRVKIRKKVPYLPNICENVLLVLFFRCFYI